ncbi:hypothetical protein HDU93_002368 [Gonapodya sp. JEL0774]|nr:hypothetical protein HDU93_002368 [Gonapodya sp. JEL0774]
MSSQSICVVATVDKDGVPRASPMGFFVDPNPESYHSFIIYLFSEGDPADPSSLSTKLKNIIANPRISVAIHTEQFKGWEQLQGVQIQGEAAEITSDRKSQTWKEGLAAYQLKRGVLLRDVLDVPKNWATCIKVVPKRIDYLVISFLANRFSPPPNQKPPPNYPQTTFDKFARVLLIATAALHFLTYLFFSPPNILATLKLSPEDPLQHLTVGMRNYALKRWDEPTANLVASEWVLSVERTREDAAYMAAMEGLNAEQQLLRTLYVRLRDPLARRFYLKYGEEAFLGCTWCQDDGDYFLHVAPSIGLVYLSTFVVLGLATERRGRRWWRHYINTALFLLGVFLDCYFFIAANDPGRVVHRGHAPPSGWSLYSFTHNWRHLPLSLLCVLVFAFDEPMETEDDRASAILDSLGTAHSSLLFTKLQRAAIMGDDALRKVVFDDAKRRSVETDVVAADPELQRARADAIVKHSLDEAMSQWNASIEQILNQAAKNDPNGDGTDGEDRSDANAVPGARDTSE